MRSPNLTCPEIEASLVGGLLFDSARIADATAVVRPSDFHDPHCRSAFRALVALDAGGAAIDFVTVASWLDNDPEVSRNVPNEGWKAWLVNRSMTSSAFVAHHASVVANTAMLRSLDVELRKLADETGDVHPELEEGVEEFVDSVESRILAVRDQRLNDTQAESLRDLVPAIEKEILSGERDAGIAIGIPDVDGLLAGTRSGELILVAARPAVGKTAFALQASLNVTRRGATVLFLTLEMSKQEIVERLLANAGGVDSSRIRSGHLDEAAKLALREAAADLRQQDLRIVEGNATTISRLRAVARRQARKGLDLIVVDYLQLMSDPSRKDRVQEVSAISRGLKNLARELRVPVLAVSQLSRAGDDDRPRLSHLRDSGALEQDADVVLLLWVEEKNGPLRCSVEKNRHGPTGDTSLAFLREYGRIAGLAREEVQLQ